MGGDGGNGGSTAGGAESGGGNGGNAVGDGIGGGIYSDDQSCPIITDCNLVNNVAATGIPGQGGAVGPGSALTPPAQPGLIGATQSYGGIAGGAVYFGEISDANITNCTFSDNKAYILNTNFGLSAATYTYTRGGALYSAKNNAVILNNCDFTGSLGGAVYCSDGCTLDVNDCSFEDNGQAVEGGAIYISERVYADIKNTGFSGNSALADGGAIYSDSDADFSDCTFNNNIAGENGGAIEAYFDTGNPEIRMVLKFTFNRCSFIRNQASRGTYGWGGAVHFQESDAVFNDCYFINNTAKSGGGLFLSAGTVAINGGVIKGNRSIGGSGINVISGQNILDAALTNAISADFIASYFDSTSIAESFNTSNGIGGGLACVDTAATIENCTLSDNTAEGVNGSGGAISFYGGLVEHLVKNCLLTGNTSAADGGAISGNLFAQPTIQNSTFINNRTSSMGGAVFSDWSSHAAITDSIFQGSNKGAIADEDSGNTTIEYCLFNSNLDGDYLLYDTLSKQVTGSKLDGTNKKGDPLFVAGPLGNYYLSQLDSGQTVDSLALNAGSGPAMNFGLSDYTTRIDGEEDTEIVDIGYHYRDHTEIPVYTLTARVAGGQGTIEPSSGTYHAGTTVTLTATPNAGWRVSKWSGTDNDSSKASSNTVTIDGTNTYIEVEFWQPAVINVPDDYQTIQDAITAANDGDKIVVDTGVYHGGYLQYALLVDKSVYITSRDPHDPNTVAATIIRGNMGISPFNYIGVVFRANTDENTVLNGFTIENFGGNWTDGDGGDRTTGHPNGEDGSPADGAGIYIEAGASPVIKNCIIRNNIINAGSGGAGVAADQFNNAGRGGWGGWARGAGIYCGPYTNPMLVNCIIEGNTANGGNGGNGGDYADPDSYANYGGNYSREGGMLNPTYDFPTTPNTTTANLIEGHLWELWAWDFAPIYGPIYGQAGLTSYIDDYRWYSGYGGGVFCDIGTSVIFDNCVIRGNRTTGGMSGQGGIQGTAGRQLEPLVPYEIPSYGGGVYCAANSKAIFDGCTFEENAASETLVDPNHRLSPYIGYGGGISAERSALVYFTDCNFVDNQADTGGAIYVNDADVKIIDCNIASNEALRGGGFLGTGGSIDIKGTIVANNRAITDVNDPNDDEVLSIGAGLSVFSADAIIQDCNISGNRADASGGGLYLRGENGSAITNCLIINNSAGRDGGGISTNWYAMPAIANCTFAGNAASGAAGEPGNTGLGGALYCGYQSDVAVTDSIFWNNFGLKGQEIAVGSGFELDPICSTVTVKYSDVKSSLNNTWVDLGCILNLKSSDGNINDDPLFVSDANGIYYYYLSHTSSGQSLTSPCVDAGSDYASHVGLLGYTTRTDRIRDKDKVDMGYHHNTEDKCRLADFVFDGVIDELDFNKFANLIGFDNFTKLAEEYWLKDPQGTLDLPSSEQDNWLNGADITTDRHVNNDDLDFLINCNGVADINAPIPDPGKWEIEPYLSSSSSVSMVAETAFDAWSRSVEYYFECNTPGGHSSSWQDSPIYTDRGLTIGLGYGYRVRARDKFGNMTEWSEVRYAGVDTIPPAPAPRIETIDANSPTSITMIATIAYDDSDVEYYFENVLGDVNDSGWQDEPNYTSVGLNPNTEYSYRVKARDKSPNQNETNWSEVVLTRTAVPADLIPPTPDPMAWDPTVDPNGFDGTPREVYGGLGTFDYYAQMTATVAADAGGGAVEYYFECTTEHGFDSGWVTDPIYRVLVGRTGQGHRFRVRARDQFGNMTAWSIEDPAN